MHRSTFLAAFAAFSINSFGGSALAAGFDHTHAALTAVLRSSVKNERVDYAALKSSPNALGNYLTTLAAVPEKSFKSWNKDQRLALKSIKDISSFFKGPWDQSVVHVFGDTVTLNHIEHDLIRAKYAEPRAHFALVCASIGCPPLRAEAFDAAKMNGQLDDQGRIFFATKSNNRVDAKSGKPYLSPIFKWFNDDFTGKSGSVEKFVAPFFIDTDKAAILSGRLSIEFTDYDWSLNKQS